MMGWGSQGYGMWGMGWFGGIMMILFWGLIVFGVVLLIRYFTGDRWGSAPMPRERNPVEILRERYARGEIGTEEFEERKKVLESG